jgi:hypothetical protein
MMLLYSPNKLFLWPGAILFGSGILLHLAVLVGLVQWDGRPAGAVTGVFATILSVVGFQILSLGLHVKTYSWTRRFDRHNEVLARFYDRFRLETGLLLGSGLVAVGLAVLATLAVQWLDSDMLPLPHPEVASFGATMVIIGFSTVFTSLFISAMSITQRERRDV